MTTNLTVTEAIHHVDAVRRRIKASTKALMARDADKRYQRKKSKVTL